MSDLSLPAKAFVPNDGDTVGVVFGLMWSFGIPMLVAHGIHKAITGKDLNPKILGGIGLATLLAMAKVSHSQDNRSFHNFWGTIGLACNGVFCLGYGIYEISERIKARRKRGH